MPLFELLIFNIKPTTFYRHIQEKILSAIRMADKSTQKTADKSTKKMADKSTKKMADKSTKKTADKSVKLDRAIIREVPVNVR